MKKKFEYSELKTDLSEFSSDRSGMISITNGILNFPNLESLEYSYNSIKNNEINYDDFINYHFENGFKPKILTDEIINNNPSVLTLDSSFVTNPYEGEGEGGEDVIDLEDDRLIADLSFASLLNFRHEVIVENRLYKYTYNGLFHGEVSDSTTIRFESSNNHYSTHQPGSDGETQLISNGLVSWFIPNHDDPPVAELCAPYPCPPPIVIDPPQVFANCGDNKDYPEALPNCISYGNFGKIFGPNLVCFQYWSTRNRRIKNKAWAMDFKLISSVGYKVKTQSKKNFLGITWWSKNNAEVSQLYKGIEVGQIVFSHPNFPSPNIFEFKHQLRYDGITYNLQTGDVVHVNDPLMRDLFKDWPVPNISPTIEIYLPDRFFADDLLYEDFVSSDQLNSAIKLIAKQAFNFLKNKLNKEFGSEDVSIFLPNSNKDDIIFYYVQNEKTKQNANRLRSSFHFSTAVISWKDKYIPSGFKPAIHPKKVDMLFYGYGRHACNDYQGSRIHLLMEN